MKLEVALRPSEAKYEGDPGHMAVFWRHFEEPFFRGYRFYVDDLPEGHNNPSTWRGYLFENTVPGYIFDDIIIRDDLKHRPELLLAELGVWKILCSALLKRLHGCGNTACIRSIPTHLTIATTA